MIRFYYSVVVFLTYYIKTKLDVLRQSDINNGIMEYFFCILSTIPVSGLFWSNLGSHILFSLQTNSACGVICLFVPDIWTTAAQFIMHVSSFHFCLKSQHSFIWWELLVENGFSFSMDILIWTVRVTFGGTVVPT